MAITDIFSKRQQKLRVEIPDVYVYDELPRSLKVQIVQIWEDIGNHHYWGDIYQSAVRILRREYGFFELVNNTRTYKLELKKFFLSETKTERSLDAVEVFLKLGKRAQTFHDAVEELNHRFKEHGVGYQYENGQIIRMDSQLIHVEIVQPALQLLSDKLYAGAEQEFLKAHEHYRKGNAKEALNECLKSFESVMKIICDKKNWAYEKNATSKQLINVCLENGLIPPYWQSHYSALRSLLESSIPTGRNKESGHGQGSDIEIVPDYLVAYMLHMTASAIVFLVEAEKNL